MIWTQPPSDTLADPVGLLTRDSVRSAPSLATGNGPAPLPRTGRHALPPEGIVPNVVMLQGVPLLRTLSNMQLHQLAARSRIVSVLRGEYIVSQGDTARSWFVLMSGRAHAMRTGSNGRGVLFESLEAGAHFGEVALIDGEPHAAGERCITHCRLLVVRGEDFLQCVTQSPEFVQNLTQVLVRRLRQANQRIASLALQDVRDRVVTFLQGSGQPLPEGWLLPKPPSRTSLAHSIGASREMVSRILKSLAREGVLVERDDGRLLLQRDLA